MAHESELEDLKEDARMTEHTMTLDELCSKLNTDADQGLTDQQAAEYLARDGPNSLTPLSKTPEWMKLVKKVFGGFGLLLWIGVALCIIGYCVDVSTSGDTENHRNLYLGIGLATVAIITGYFQYHEEAENSKLIESSIDKIPRFAVVTRNGQKKTIYAKELVVGDVVHLEAGDQIPADMRIIEQHGLKVNVSALTGESEPQTRSVECTSDNPLETKNLVFLFTNVVAGTGRGIVINTGKRTVMGSIAHLASVLDTGETSIAARIVFATRLITGVAVFLGVLLFVISFAIGQSWMTDFSYRRIISII